MAFLHGDYFTLIYANFLVACIISIYYSTFYHRLIIRSDEIKRLPCKCKL